MSSISSGAAQQTTFSLAYNKPNKLNNNNGNDNNGIRGIGGSNSSPKMFSTID